MEAGTAAQKARKKYNQSEKGKASRKKRNASEKGKESRKKYMKGTKGKEIQKRYSEKRRKYIQDEKMRRGCVDCGYNKHPVALEFDHISGVKKFQISKMKRSLRSLQEEMNKCVVRCSNCHRIMTFERRQHIHGAAGDLQHRNEEI